MGNTIPETKIPETEAIYKTVKNKTYIPKTKTIPSTEYKEILDEEISKSQMDKLLNPLGKHGKSSICPETLCVHGSTSSGCAAASTDYNFPDWRENARIVKDDETGFELLYLPVGTILFRGGTLYMSREKAPPGYYGNFSTAYIYAFGGTKTFDMAKLMCYQVVEPIYLLNITHSNLKHLIETESKELNDREFEHLKNLISILFGYKENKPTLQRYSHISTDYSFSNFICELGFNGYGYKQIQGLRPEVMLCSGDNLRVIPIEFRVFEAFPDCILQINGDDRRIINVLKLSAFGGSEIWETAVRGPFPEAFPSGVHKDVLETFTKVRDPLFSEAAQKMLADQLTGCKCTAEKLVADKLARRGKNFIQRSRATALESLIDAPLNNSEIKMSPELLDIKMSFGASEIPKELWNTTVRNALAESYHLIPPRHHIADNFEVAYKQYIDSAKSFNRYTVGYRPDVIKIMTWNIQMLRNFSREKLDPIINNLPDILALQEVDFRTSYIALVEELSKYGYYTSTYCKPIDPVAISSTQYLSNVILVRTAVNPFSIYDVKSLDLVRTGYTQEGRCLSMMRVGQVYILNTHLDVYDHTGLTRDKQIDDIIQVVNSFPRGQPVVLMGDFNTVRDIDADESHLKWLYEYTPQGFHIRRPDSIARLQSLGGFMDASDLLGIKIPVTVWTGSRVDFILVKNIPPEQIRAVYTIFTEESDHLPVVMEVYRSILGIGGKTRPKRARDFPEELTGKSATFTTARRS